MSSYSASLGEGRGYSAGAMNGAGRGYSGRGIGKGYVTRGSTNEDKGYVTHGRTNDGRGYSSSGTTAYAMKLNTWIADIGHDFPQYRSDLNQLRTLALSGAVNDKMLYYFAKGVQKEINREAPVQDQHNQRYKLMPFVRSNGTVRYMDMISGAELDIIRMPNGHYAYDGPHWMLEVLGGRGLGSKLRDDLSDGNLFRNVKN